MSVKVRRVRLIDHADTYKWQVLILGAVFRETLHEPTAEEIATCVQRHAQGLPAFGPAPTSMVDNPRTWNPSARTPKKRGPKPGRKAALARGEITEEAFD